MKKQRKQSLENKVEVLKNKKARLISITCIHKKAKEFELVYHFDVNGKFVTLQVRQKKPLFKSIIDVFPSAEIYEREAHEMFDIEFDNPAAQKGLFFSE